MSPKVHSFKHYAMLHHSNAAAAAKSLQSCRTLQPHDCSPPGSSVHGIFQARVLEWGAIAFSDSNASIPVYLFILYFVFGFFFNLF